MRKKLSKFPFIESDREFLERTIQEMYEGGWEDTAKALQQELDNLGKWKQKQL